jgi:hypothetical protein
MCVMLYLLFVGMKFHSDKSANRPTVLLCIFSYRFVDESVALLSLLVTIRITCYNIVKCCILSTECIYVFHTVLTINSICFPKEH